MSKIELIIRIACVVIGALGSLIPSCIAFYKALKKRINSEETAKTEAEDALAKNDMISEFINIVANVETTFQAVNDVVKNQTGEGVGEEKKEVALAKLSNYASENGYEFDSEAWSKVADSLVNFANSFTNKQ